MYVPELIRQDKQAVDPAYTWGSSFNDFHHLLWPSRAYLHLPESKIIPLEFRNLSIIKIYAPRVFHNWVHRITEPPLLPSKEVMYYRTEAQRVVVALFKSMRAGRGLTRRKGLQEFELESRLIQNFDEFSNRLEIARTIPSEFQLLDIINYNPKRFEDMFKIQSQLGKIAMVPVVTRSVSLPAVA